MPKFEIQLTLYRTVETVDIDAAADIADYNHSLLMRSKLLNDLGWTEVVTKVKSKKETN
jgi:hypothetical protein